MIGPAIEVDPPTTSTSDPQKVVLFEFGVAPYKNEKARLCPWCKLPEGDVVYARDVHGLLWAFHARCRRPFMRAFKKVVDKKKQKPEESKR